MVKMSVSIYLKGDYEEFHALRWRNNKLVLSAVEWSQFKANLI